MRSGEVDFNDIWGKEFRVPTIVGEGSGAGFNFSNLHLPRGWEEVVPKSEVSPEKLQKLLDWYCQMFHLSAGKIEFYPENQVLKEVSIKTRPVSRLKLDTEFPYNQEGRYQGKILKI